MNWDRMEGAWKQRRGKAVRHWGTMMNDELAAIAGNYEELVGRLQEQYGLATEDAKHQLQEFRRIVGQLKESNYKLTVAEKELRRHRQADGKAAKSQAPAKKSVRSRPGGKVRHKGTKNA